jgi:RimJ/RimL family protein N-acetyltransferase
MWESGISYIYSVLTADHGTLVGEIGLHRRSGDGSIEIGYWIAGAHSRRGFGTSAAGAVTGVALALPGVRRVEIHCDVANTASAAIPRKLGYRLDRVEVRQPEAPGESGQLMIWVQERAERE